MSDPRFPRTAIIPYSDVLKATLKLCGYPPEMAETHEFEFHGDVHPDKGSFTLAILSCRPKESQTP
ncbi:MAG TPA: hypothetical protein VHO25_04610 [Polyangiaceae bacterium]|nr:hypothetical protein [Polyangiaceae bacterium]